MFAQANNSIYHLPETWTYRGSQNDNNSSVTLAWGSCDGLHDQMAYQITNTLAHILCILNTHIHDSFVFA